MKNYPVELTTAIGPYVICDILDVMCATQIHTPPGGVTVQFSGMCAALTSVAEKRGKFKIFQIRTIIY